MIVLLFGPIAIDRASEVMCMIVHVAHGHCDVCYFTLPYVATLLHITLPIFM